MKHLAIHREMMASRREPDNSASLKKIRSSWNNIASEENEGNVTERNSFLSTIRNQPYTKLITLGIGPCREDCSGTSKDIYDKGKAMVRENTGDSRSIGPCTNWLTLKLSRCIEDGSNKHISDMFEAKDAYKKGEASWSLATHRISSCRKDDSNKRVKVMKESIFVDDILSLIFCKLPLHTIFQLQIICSSWKTFISSSICFHNLWEKTNMQMWLLIDLYHGEINDSSKGFA